MSHLIYTHTYTPFADVFSFDRQFFFCWILNIVKISGQKIKLLKLCINNTFHLNWSSIFCSCYIYLMAANTSSVVDIKRDGRTSSTKNEINWGDFTSIVVLLMFELFLCVYAVDAVYSHMLSLSIGHSHISTHTYIGESILLYQMDIYHIIEWCMWVILLDKMVHRILMASQNVRDHAWDCYCDLTDFYTYPHNIKHTSCMYM